MRRASVYLVALAIFAAACAEGETEDRDTDLPRVVKPVTTTRAPSTSDPDPADPSTTLTTTSYTGAPSTAAGSTLSPVTSTTGATTIVTPATSAAESTTTTTEAPTTTTTTTATPTTAANTTTTTTSTSTTTTTTPSTSTTTTTAPPQLALGLEVVAEGFAQPVLVISPPGDPRLFVVDQPGRIFVIDGGQLHTFLDIRDDVRFRGEQGLLGLAFHPRYSSNGRFYVDFIDNGGDTVLAEFSVSSNPNAANAGSRRDILEVDQPASNHNGGMIAFGPDGYLWFGLGDGGGSNDTYGNGQRSDRRLASMIRVDVGPGSPLPYGDPVGQPFVGDGGLPEVWSIGLRNPWRWAFDGDDLYIADVGQNSHEEINVVPADAAGLNFGWPILEGTRCRLSDQCSSIETARGMPLLTYSHSQGCSVTGGFVYRGSSIPELRGHYFFGDYCGGWIDSVRVSGSRRVLERERWFEPGTAGGLTSFGIDSSGEVYVLTRGGTVYRIVAA